MKRQVKNITSIVLLVLLNISIFSYTIVATSFQVNKKYIVEKLCVNRAKPEKKCNGKCYLKKELKKAQETQSQANNHQQKEDNNKIEINFYHFSNEHDATNLPIFYVNNGKYAYYSNFSPHKGFYFPLEKPPII